ncbi:MAG TPA: site-2 protease family protein [Gemmataceae bacterium]|nr:site-2 protease family protein [Gemmataceae bacterium]
MSRNGSFRLFRLAGIDVYLHWSWLLVAFFEVQSRGQLERYDRPVWNWIEYLSLFGIVLMHEFGHALACRQVGGIANHIVLWPLGGVAYVNPPPQPGAVLWSIAAGPLVNVFLVPVTVGLFLVSNLFHWGDVYPDLAQYLTMMMVINFVLLGFNLLPVYPLDGGQILQSLLWFMMGRARSLMVVSIIGIVVGGCALIVALILAAYGVSGVWWPAIIAAFVAFRAVVGLQQARLLARILSGPRHKEAACPSCGVSPLAGNYWTCDECGTRFDTFKCQGQCPGCGQLFRVTKCPECYKQNPIGQWFTYSTPPDGSPQQVPR